MHISNYVEQLIILRLFHACHFFHDMTSSKRQTRILRSTGSLSSRSDCRPVFCVRSVVVFHGAIIINPTLFGCLHSITCCMTRHATYVAAEAHPYALMSITQGKNVGHVHLLVTVNILKFFC